ncbi:diguanylate cyclase/phosphodiesterase [Methylovorus glucosotrophus]|uniref:putative bifunctional diguanylate cyclase/phosphodiesterase n=1 Tax=Methylovorus glucosotrophus TaxID=266009 RepID=UPI0013318DB7|nr:bifunctional diguanylate cyclase/phosphodiesterase [Methylovorus glucosotrophus]KAF0843231.1 diguanylate cyclase/phosphodiesterase [Methylovorus glucosotrophus]
MPGIETTTLETVRQRVIDRLAALMESQTRTKAFGGEVVQLIRSVHQDTVSALKAIAEHAKNQDTLSSVEGIIQTFSRLDSTLNILFQERNRQWYRNGDYVQALMGEFHTTLSDLSDTLIEKDLLERQSAVLERIILSHEHVSHWQEFVQEILADFHSIFPFNFFYIAFSEESGLSLFLYFIGNHSENSKKIARELCTTQVLNSMNITSSVALDIEEFYIKATGDNDSSDDLRMITVTVPQHTPKLAGLLGVAYVSTANLTPQEDSVLRSILSVMVMVVGSSKVLSRSLAELEYYSMHDPLTGLYNRRQFNHMLEYEIGRSARHQHEFSLLLLDLDDFKDINDTYGHLTGDEVLRGVAEILQSNIRMGDLAARIGGDEFVVILTETNREGARVVAEALGKCLRDKSFFSSDNREFHQTVSIGIANYPNDTNNLTDLLAGMDVAMYRAKEMGKNGSCTLDALKDRVETSRLTRDYAEKLRKALQEKRFIPYYQPIVNCRTQEVFAYETLARLVEPTGETISAGIFIEAIEKYGLARELDRAIIEHAFNDKYQLHNTAHPEAKLFLNLSAQEIQGRGILGYAEELCHQLKIPPSHVVFEILERDAISDMTNMRKFLAKLRDKGFAFALDDFGSGYNSFHYLRELRFEYVKIDGAFVRNILNSKVDYALVSNLSRLCHDLGIQTIAEFVENQEILEALQHMKIDYVQGFHISLPKREMN